MNEHIKKLSTDMIKTKKKYIKNAYHSFFFNSNQFQLVQQREMGQIKKLRILFVQTNSHIFERIRYLFGRVNFLIGQWKN